MVGFFLIYFFEVLLFFCSYTDVLICLKCGQRDLTPPFVDDGLLEIVGFRDAWHGLVLLAPKGHGTRLAQVRNKLWLLQMFVQGGRPMRCSVSTIDQLSIASQEG